MSNHLSAHKNKLLEPAVSRQELERMLYATHEDLMCNERDPVLFQRRKHIDVRNDNYKNG